MEDEEIDEELDKQLRDNICDIFICKVCGRKVSATILKRDGFYCFSCAKESNKNV